MPTKFVAPNQFNARPATRRFAAAMLGEDLPAPIKQAAAVPDIDAGPHRTPEPCPYAEAAPQETQPLQRQHKAKTLLDAFAPAQPPALSAHKAAIWSSHDEPTYASLGAGGGGASAASARRGSAASHTQGRDSTEKDCNGFSDDDDGDDDNCANQRNAVSRNEGDRANDSSGDASLLLDSEFIPVFFNADQIRPHANESHNGQVPWRCSNCHSHAFGHRCAACNRSRDSAALRVFIGQLCREGADTMAHAILRTLCSPEFVDGSVIHIEAHTNAKTRAGKGCVWVYVNSLADIERIVHAVHKKTYVTVCTMTGEVGFRVFTHADHLSEHDILGEFSAERAALPDGIHALLHHAPVTAEMPVSLQKSSRLPPRSFHQQPHHHHPAPHRFPSTTQSAVAPPQYSAVHSQHWPAAAPSAPAAPPTHVPLPLGAFPYFATTGFLPPPVFAAHPAALSPAAPAPTPRYDAEHEEDAAYYRLHYGGGAFLGPDVASSSTSSSATHVISTDNNNNDDSDDDDEEASANHQRRDDDAEHAVAAPSKRFFWNPYTGLRVTTF